MKVCFVGLGTMGLPMAQRLMEEGIDIAGWDAVPGVGRELPGRTDTLEAAASDSDIVITMLPEDAHVEEVHGALLASEGPGRRVFVDSSTISVTTTRELAARAKHAGHGFVDAPVSGGAEGARAGTLSLMIGGEKENVASVMPVLQAMSSKITHFGAAGSGQAAKACHNMICGITALGVCEAFALADALGLDQQKFFDLCAGAAAQSWILENRCPVPGPAPNAPASNGYAPGFAARLMAKDLRLAQAAADASGQPTPFGSQASRQFTAFAEDTDAGNLDFSAIYRTIRRS